MANKYTQVEHPILPDAVHRVYELGNGYCVSAVSDTGEVFWEVAVMDADYDFVTGQFVEDHARGVIHYRTEAEVEEIVNQVKANTENVQ